MGNLVGGHHDQRMINLSSKYSPNFLGWLYAASSGPELRRMEVVLGVTGTPELASGWQEEHDWCVDNRVINESLDNVSIVADPGRRMIIAIGKGNRGLSSPVYGYQVDRSCWRKLPDIPFLGPEGFAVHYSLFHADNNDLDGELSDEETAPAEESAVVDRLFTVGGEWTDEGDWMPLTHYNYDVNVFYLDCFLREERDVDIGHSDVDEGDWKWESWSNHPLGQVTGHATVYCPYENCLYVHGGIVREMAGDVVQKALYKFNLKTYAWTRLPNSHQPHGWHHPLVVDVHGRVYALFGAVSSGTFETGSCFERYDPKKNSWELLPEPFSSHHHILPTGTYIPPTRLCRRHNAGSEYQAQKQHVEKEFGRYDWKSSDSGRDAGTSVGDWWEQQLDDGYVAVYSTVLNTVRKGELGLMSMFDVRAHKWVSTEECPGDFAKLLGAGSAVYRSLVFMPASPNGVLTGDRSHATAT